MAPVTAPIEVASYSVTDSFFGAPYVDRDENNDAPTPHRYVHGGFDGTHTLFSLYRQRSLVGLALMIAQAFFYNAIFFTFALMLTDFYGIPSNRIGWYLLHLFVFSLRETTDDAYVNGHVTFVAPRVAGRVMASRLSIAGEAILIAGMLAFGS